MIVHEISSKGQGGLAAQLLAEAALQRGWTVVRVTGKGALEVRLLPAVIDGSIQPQYINLESFCSDPAGHISDALLQAETAVFWGTGPTLGSFLSPEPALIKSKGHRQSPARTIYWQLYELKKNKPRECPDEVHALFVRIPDKGTPISKPSMALYMQGIVYGKEGRQIFDEETGAPAPIFPAIILLNQESAKNDLLEKLKGRLDQNMPLAIGNNRMGDILGLEGHILKIDPKTEYNPQTKKEQTRYYGELGPQITLDPNFVQSTAMPWDRLLKFPTIEENILQIERCIGAVATYLGLKGTEYNSEITPALKARAEAAMGIVQAQPAAPAQPNMAWQPQAPQQAPAYAAPAYAPPQQVPQVPAYVPPPQAPQAAPPQAPQAPQAPRAPAYAPPAYQPGPVVQQAMDKASITYQPRSMPQAPVQKMDELPHMPTVQQPQAPQAPQPPPAVAPGGVVDQEGLRRSLAAAQDILKQRQTPGGSF